MRSVAKPVRILHVVGSMNLGGVETWLMHALRNIDRDRYRMDFLVHTDQPAIYDAEIRALDSRIIARADPHVPLRYAKRFLEAVRDFGPYDVLHSHVHNFSGYVVWLGARAGIPIRISHSHNDTQIIDRAAPLVRKVYLSFTRWLMMRYSSSALAASVPAAEALFGPSWTQSPLVSILYYGIDLRPYHSELDRTHVRNEFHFRPEHIVFGHVGRFDPQKNHQFLIDIAVNIVKREPQARFLLVGDGPLRASIEEMSRHAGLGNHVVFAGLRQDISRLMRGAMDAFLFPSVHEGLGLVLVEAQAAGVPIIMSDRVPKEAVIIHELVTSLPLSESASTWAEVSLEHQHQHVPNACTEVERSAFNIVNSASALCSVYSPGPGDRMRETLLR